MSQKQFWLLQITHMATKLEIMTEKPVLFNICTYLFYFSTFSMANQYISLSRWWINIFLSMSSTNESGPLPLCTFSVMGLSMCSSIFSESSPVRSKSGIINELSGLPNSVPTVRCSYTSFSWYGHTGHAYCICFVGKH